MKGAHSLADDHTNRSGTGLFIRFGGHGPVSELPDLEHRRYDHRRLFCPWGGGLCHAGRRGTPDPGHSCRHAGGQLRRIRHRFFADPPGDSLHSGGHRHQHGPVHRQSDGDGLESQPEPAGRQHDLHPSAGQRHRRRLVRVAAGGFCHRSGGRTAADISENTHGPFHPGHRR